MKYSTQEIQKLIQTPGIKPEQLHQPDENGLTPLRFVVTLESAFEAINLIKDLAKAGALMNSDDARIALHAAMVKYKNPLVIGAFIEAGTESHAETVCSASELCLFQSEECLSRSNSSLSLVATPPPEPKNRPSSGT